MLKHKKLLASAVAVIAAIGVVACGAPEATPPVKVSLIGLNDFHGNLLPLTGTVTVADPAVPAGTRVSAGGAAYMATLVNDLKAQNPNTLVVAAGDLIGASPLTSALFHDEPTIDALNLIGLDVASVGNHEFDMGATELKRIQSGGCFPLSSDGTRGVIGVDTCLTNGAFAGAKYTYLAANVVEAATGKTLFPSYAIRTVAGYSIAFIGLTLKDTPSVVTPAGIAGLRFTDEVTTVNALIPELKAKGVSSIVVLIHQGGFTTASMVNDKTCPGLSGDIVALADQFDKAVDVVISGHSHQEYNCVRPDGKILTQAGLYGRILTKVDLMISPDTRKVVSKEANNIPVVNDVGVRVGGVLVPLPAGVTALAKNTAVDVLIQRFVNLTAPITNQVIGNLESLLTRTVNSAGESQVGDVVADSYLAGSQGAAYGTGAGQIGMSNTGGVRANLDAGLQVTYGNLFTVTPFGNNLVTVTMTGAQIKRVLEQQWESPQPANGRVMQVSNGFTYTWDGSTANGAAPGTGNRVVDGSIKLNGVAIGMASTYRVTINNFMASGGDNLTVFTQATNSQSGVIDINAGVAYFKAQGTVATPGQNRIRRIN
jgi:5'-nucleotidase